MTTAEQVHEAATAVSPATMQARADQVRRIYPHARVLNAIHLEPVLKTEAAKRQAESAPKSLTLITPDPDDPSTYQLFVGSEPIARQSWSFDPHMETLSFKQGSGDRFLAGNLRLVHHRTAAHGALQVGDTAFGVELAAKGIEYNMQTAANAAYVAGDPPKLVWDVNSSRWKDATWSPMNMRFTYGIETSGVIAGQKVYFISCVFEDLTTREIWQPDALSYTAYMTMDLKLTFHLNPGFNPSPDPFNPLASFRSLRFPYQFEVKLDPFGVAYEGAMLCGSDTKSGTVYGVKGVTASTANLSGIYLLSGDGGDAQPRLIGAHSGRLVIDQQIMTHSRQNGSRIEWDALPPGAAEASGLPPAGHLEFSPGGATISSGTGGLTGRRITAEEAAELAPRLSYLPALAEALQRASQPAAAQLNLLDLVNMSQFARNGDNQYYDKIQEQSMGDFYEILKYYMPEDLRKTFISPNPVNLAPPVQTIASTPGWNGASPSTFYSGMSTAYITATLANWGDDPAAKTLNAKRAQKWMSDQTSASGVYGVQGPALYAYRWILENPTTQEYINDQKANWRTYEPIIKEDVVVWKAEILNEVAGISTPEQLAALLKTVDEVEAKAIDQNYWAYAVYRYCTQPSFLNLLQVISFSGGSVDGSEFMQRVERTAAVLNVLDPTSFFSQQFAYVVQLFQMSNILPQLIDYTGDLEDYSYATNAIWKEFIKTYIESPDPDLAKAARQLQELQQQGYLHDLLILFQQAAVARSGIYQWSLLAADFESRVAKVFGALPQLGVMLVALGAVSFMVIAFATGQIQWSSLSTGEQVALVSMSTMTLATFALAITRRAIAFRVVFQPGSGLWNGLKLFFSPKLITQAQNAATTGIRGWFIQQGTAPAANMAAAAANAAQEVGQVSRLTRVTRFVFGRNLSEFVATRIGGILAVLGIVMSALSLAKSTDALEIAANALFLAASTLQLIAVVGSWAVAGGLTTVGGLSVAAMVSVIGLVGVVAMLAGAVLLIIYLTKKHPTPVEKFAKNQAAQDGFYMAYETEIDYFEFYQVGAGPQQAGVAMAADGDSQRCLKMSVDGGVLAAPMDHSAATSFYLLVDGSGRTQVIAPLTGEGNTPASRVLTLTPEGNLKAAEAITDPKLAGQQQWIAEMLGGATRDNGHLQAAPFALYNAAYFAKHGVKMYLHASGNTVQASPTRTSWLLQMVTTKPEGLRMNDIQLDTYDMDSSFDPGLNMIGSQPHTWSIQPALPAFMRLNAATGTVSQVTGVEPQVLPPTTYTLRVVNPAGSASTTFSVTVKAVQAVQAA